MSDAPTGWTGDLTDCLSKIWRERLSACDDPSSVAGALADIATPVDLKTQLLSELIRGRRAADGEGRALRVVLSLLLGTRVFSASRVLYEMPEALAVIEAELAPSPFWIEHIRSLARSAVEADLAEAMTDSAVLSSMIGSAWLEAEADQIRLPLCEPISFDRLFEVLSPDGIALMRVRSRARSVEVFDRAVERAWATLRPGVVAGFHAVLDGNEVDIHDYLSIFPKAAEERELLACALMRLRKQVELKIGCTIGPSLDEMLVVMGMFRCWDGGALRTFTRLSPPRSSSAHYLDAYRTAVRELWRNDPPTAAFAALSMLRQARVLVRDTTVDPGELEKCRVLVDALDASQSVGWLADRFEDLPLGPRPEPAEWWALSDRDKEHWRSRVLDRISRQDAAGIGLCEYILTWTGKMEYADLEPLVVAILDRDGDYSLLVDMSRPLAGAGSIRAGSLLSSLRSMPMAYDLRDVGGHPKGTR